MSDWPPHSLNHLRYAFSTLWTDGALRLTVALVLGAVGLLAWSFWH